MLFNGDIRAENQPEKGSVFHVSWPLVVSEKQAHPALADLLDTDILFAPPTALRESTPVQVPSLANSDPKPAVLVVEDNPGLREYLLMILSEKYHVLLAENGVDALQKTTSSNFPIDLVLSDLIMPVMDGYQLLEKLKSGAATRHMPVIMLTARAEFATPAHALRIGVDDYLTKPFEEEELLVRIANLLKNQSVRRQEAVTVGSADTELRHSETDQAWLEKFEEYIRDNLASGTVTIPALGETFAMSESSLLRQLKRLTGLSPVQYLLQIRLDEARLLLESGTHDSVTTVASLVGYKDARSFSRSFKKRFGKLPSDL